jgi:hypothetical protein
LITRLRQMKQSPPPVTSCFRTTWFRTPMRRRKCPSLMLSLVMMKMGRSLSTVSF